MYKLIIVLILMPNVVFSQSKGNLTFGLDYQHVYSKMELVDVYLADTNIFNSSFYGNPQKNTLSQTHSVGFELDYQPLAFQDFGLGFNYQFAYINRTPRTQYPDPIQPNQLLDFNGYYNLKADAYSVNLLSKTFFSKLLDFESSSSIFLKKMILATEFQLGVGLARLRDEIAFENPYTYSLQQHNRKSINLKGQASIIIGYPICEKSVFTSVNFKLGYQFFKTSTLKNNADEEYLVNDKNASKPLVLNFSGLALGVMLTFRK